MKTYILTAELKVTDETIQKARKWQKRNRYDYKDDIAHLVMNYLMDGNFDDCELEEMKLDQISESKGFRQYINH